MAVLSEILLDKVAALTGVRCEEINPLEPLSAYGMDSMMSIRLQQWLGEYGVDSMMAVRLQKCTLADIEAEAAFEE